MKEYKSISIIVNTIPGLGEKLNEYAQKGWYIKDTITNGVHCGENSEYIYLMERDDHMVRVSGETMETVNGQIIGGDIEKIVASYQTPKTRFKNLKHPPEKPKVRTIKENK